MDKIYSRKRIHIYKINKFKMISTLFLILVILSLYYYLKSAYPVLAASCENAAYSRVNSIVTEEIKNIMKEYKYDDLITIEKDNNGEIRFLKSNVLVMNEMVADITQRIQENIDKQARIVVFINMGTISGISKLDLVGPKFEIELEAAGDTKVNLSSKFESAGINQTIHKIYVDIDAYIKIITPFGNFEKDMKSKVLLTETIIVGDVPSTYYDLDGMENDSLLNLIE